MKKLFIFLSLVMVVNVQAAHSGDGNMSELQKILARRRVVQGESPTVVTSSTSTPRATTAPRSRVAVPQNVQQVLGQGTSNRTNSASSASTTRVGPPVSRRPTVTTGRVTVPQSVQQVFGQRGANHGASASSRRVAPPVAPRPSIVPTVAPTPPVAAERNPACSVCQEPNTHGLVKLDCSHDFHKECLLPWVTGRDAYGGRQEHCPNCRTPITDADKTKLGIAVQAVAPFTASSNYVSPEIQSHRDINNAGVAAALNRVNATIAVLPNGRRRIYGSRSQVIGHLSARIANNLENDDLLGRAAQIIEILYRENGITSYNENENLDSLVLSHRDAIETNNQLRASANRAAEERTAEYQRRAYDSAAETQRLLNRANRHLDATTIFGSPHIPVERPMDARSDQEEVASIREDRLTWATSVRIDGVRGIIGYLGGLNMDNKGLRDVSGLQRLSAADKAKVRSISLRNNGIQNLPLGVFSNFPNLTEIDLTGNPLDGDVSPYVMDHSEINRLQKIRGLDLAELLEVRQMLDLPMSVVPAHLHAIHSRPFAKEILDKLIDLTMNS